MRLARGLPRVDNGWTMIHAYFISLVAVVLAEMGDKTQLLAMAFASRIRWRTVLWAVLAATLVNHLLAVGVGNVATQILPMKWITLVASASFIAFGLWTIRGDKLEGEDKREGRSPFWTVAVAFFFAEMGDKTQLMTIALAADEAVHMGGSGLAAKLQQIIPVWMGTTSGMIVADSIGIIVGIVMHKHIPESAVKWVAASCFMAFGLIGMHQGLDQILAEGVRVHHVFLLGFIPILLGAMWLLSRQRRGAADSDWNPSGHSS